MNRKRLFIILGVIVLLFLGIFTFAQGNNEEETDNKNNNGSEEVIDDPNGNEEGENEEEEGTEVVTVIPDTTAPIIVLKGNEVVYLNVGSTYTDAGATVTDNRDRDKAATVSGTVDTTKAGIYTLTYSGSDKAGNEATVVTRTVYVKPVITVNPLTDIVYEMGDMLPVFSATALFDTLVAEEILSPAVPFDPSIMGEQILRYNYTSNGIAADEKTIKVLVQDTIAPTQLSVTLNVKGSDELYTGGWTNKGVVASIMGYDNGSGIERFQYSFDNGTTWIDGEELDKSVSTSTITFDTDMETTVIFRAVDRAGLYSENTGSYDLLIDTTDPVITMNGDSPITITRSWDIFRGFSINYTDARYTYVEDNFASESTTVIYTRPYATTEETVANVNVNVGTYEIHYAVTDLAGNTAEAVRTVYVIRSIDETDDIEINVGKTKFTVCTSLECPELTVADFNVTARDWWNGALFSASNITNITVITNVNTRILGKYTATFTATDWRGKTKSITKEIEIIDNIKPELVNDGFINVNVQGVDVSLPKYSARDNYWTDLTVSTEYVYENAYREVWSTGWFGIPYISAYYKDIYLKAVVYTTTDGSGNKQTVRYDLPARVLIKSERIY